MRLLHLTLRSVLLSTIAVGACSTTETRRRVAPPEVTEFAHTFLEMLRVGNDSAVIARLTPRLQRMDGIRDSLAASRAQFPPNAPDHVELVDAQAFFPSGEAATRRALAYELQAGDTWTVASLLIIEEFGVLFVDGLGIRRSPASLRAIHRFTLEGKTPAHLAMFTVLIGVVTFSLVTAVLVLQTPMRRRWLWAVVALLGAGKFGFNWTTGETFTQILSVQLLGAGIYRGGVAGPWLLLVSFPAGALMALERRRRALASMQSPAPDEDRPAPAAELAVAPDERDV